MEHIRTSTIEVTPEIAQQWLEMYRYEHQRKPRREKVEAYARDMTRGAWLPYRQIVITSLGDQRYLTDGQHRLLAIVESGKPQWFEVCEKRASGLEELAREYYTTDRGLTRTRSDAYRSTGVGELLGLSDTNANAAGAAIRYVLAGFSDRNNKASISDDDTISAMIDYGESIIAFFADIEGAGNTIVRFLTRRGVTAVALVTYQYSIGVYGEQPIVNFWHGAAMDDGLRRGDPRKVLLDKLAETTHAAGAGRGKRAVSADYIARYTANCFNAWVDRREFATGGRNTGSKVYDTSAPIVINGTPWRGAR